MAARILKGDDFPITSTSFLQDVISSFSKNSNSLFLEDVATGSKYTYKEVYRIASGVSTALRELGIKPGDLVLVASPSNPEAVFFIIGVWLSGAANININPLLPVDEIRNFLKTAKSKVAYAGEAFVEKLQQATTGLDHLITLVSPNGKTPVKDYFDWAKSGELVTHVEQPLGSEHMIAVYFTSGTTGVPKGAVIRDGALKFGGHVLAASNIGHRLLVMSPIFWISNAMLVITSIFNGACVILLGTPTAEKALQAINDFKPSYWFSGPSLLIEITNRPDLEKYDLSSLSMVVVGGSVLLPEIKKMMYEKLFGNRNILHTVYACTEVLISTFESHLYPIDSPWFSTLGKVMSGVSIKIVDTASGEILGPNKIGEICVKSPSVIKSYLNRKLTDEELDKDGFWHMGDLGFYDEEGCMHYHCRMKELMKYREYQIAPAELEIVIQSHPSVLESAVVGKLSPEYGDLPTAFVILKSGANLTEQELFDYVAERVVDQKKLRGGIYFVKELPKSATGKVLKQALFKTFKID